MSFTEKDDVLKKGVETPTESPPSILTGSSNGDEARLAQAGYEQQLDRTFSLPSLIALSLCLMGEFGDDFDCAGRTPFVPPF